MRDGGYRRVNCPVFPYFIAYIIRRETIVIVAVAHCHRFDHELSADRRCHRMRLACRQTVRARHPVDQNVGIQKHTDYSGPTDTADHSLKDHLTRRS